MTDTTAFAMHTLTTYRVWETMQNGMQVLSIVSAHSPTAAIRRVIREQKDLCAYEPTSRFDAR